MKGPRWEGEKMKDLKTLLIELNEVSNSLELIQNSPEYINQRVKEVFKDRPKRDYNKEINALLNTL